MSQTGTAGTPGAIIPAAAPARHRREYLDWLRGVAVLVMIEGHLLDAWTRPADRETALWGYTVLLNGMGAPLFLFLAGVSVVLAATAREGRVGTAAAAASVRRRGLQIFGYAFLFRLQAFLLSPGSSPLGLLKVDILNVMGPAIVLAAALWQWGRRMAGRVLLLGGATVALAFVTPLVRATPLLDPLPDPLEWYFRPSPGRTNFTLIPWAGYVTAGALAGLALVNVQGGTRERRRVVALAAGGLLVSALGYGASYLPSIYEHSNFWTSSPTYFFLRAGLLAASVGLAFAWEARPWRRPDAVRPAVVLGRSSLFVYWIHIELVYGVVATPLHRALPLGQSLVALVIFAGLMYLAVRAKDRVVAAWRRRHPP